jgi:hypothetical protein
MNCSSCGRSNANDVTFCEFCGAKQGAASSPASFSGTAPVLAAAGTQPSASEVAAMGKQIGKSFLNSLALGEKFVGAGFVAATLGFFLPAISISVPDKAGELVAFLLGGLGQGGGMDTHTSVSLFDVTKLLGMVYFILLTSLTSGVLFYLSLKANTSKKLLLGGFQIAIGSLFGPVLVVVLLFVPGMGSIAGIGYWLLALGYCAIAAGGLMTIAALGKTA